MKVLPGRLYRYDAQEIIPRLLGMATRWTQLREPAQQLRRRSWRYCSCECLWARSVRASTV